MKVPTVSFVVPCYRLAHLLPECINSILGQTYRDLEVLIMEEMIFPLSALSIGKRARVCDVRADSGLKRRLLDLGLTEGTEVEAVHRSPAGDPVAYLIRGAVIALRSEDASSVTLRW